MVFFEGLQIIAHEACIADLANSYKHVEDASEKYSATHAAVFLCEIFTYCANKVTKLVKTFHFSFYFFFVCNPRVFICLVMKNYNKICITNSEDDLSLCAVVRNCEQSALLMVLAHRKLREFPMSTIITILISP